MENTTEQESKADTIVEETEVHGMDKGKLFTQEEVNSIIQSRISRMKAQLSKEAESTYDSKMQQLHEREMKILVKEQLDERGMSKDLADIITCTDENDLKNKLDVLEKIYGCSKAAGIEAHTGFIQIGSNNNNGNIPIDDPVRKAMGLQRKDDE